MNLIEPVGSSFAAPAVAPAAAFPAVLRAAFPAVLADDDDVAGVAHDALASVAAFRAAFPATFVDDIDAAARNAARAAAFAARDPAGAAAVHDAFRAFQAAENDAARDPTDADYARAAAIAGNNLANFCNSANTFAKYEGKAASHAARAARIDADRAGPP